MVRLVEQLLEEDRGARVGEPTAHCDLLSSYGFPLHHGAYVSYTRQSKNPSEQAMLETIVQSAQSQDTGGYFVKRGFSIQGGGREDLVGWIEEQGGEDTQGFKTRFAR